MTVVAIERAPDRRGSRSGRWPWLAAHRSLRILLLIAGVLAAGGSLVIGTGYRYAPLPRLGDPPAVAVVSPGSTPESPQPDGRRLLAELRRSAPRGLYIVIDRTHNRLYLKRGEKTLLDAVCSTGSGSILRQPDGSREWVFDTPAGRFEVRGKVTNPVWRRPDWAYIEEGQPIPPDPAERFEYGSLGRYALDLGNGYLIHGTLYERLLGRSVTHGCIRLGRDDLRQVYEAAALGTPVYIF